MLLVRIMEAARCIEEGEELKLAATWQMMISREVRWSNFCNHNEIALLFSQLLSAIQWIDISSSTEVHTQIGCSLKTCNLDRISSRALRWKWKFPADYLDWLPPRATGNVAPVSLEWDFRFFISVVIIFQRKNKKFPDLIWFRLTTVVLKTQTQSELTFYRR